MKVKCTKSNHRYWTEGKIYNSGEGVFGILAVSDNQVEATPVWIMQPFKYDKDGIHYHVSGDRRLAEFVEYHEEYPL